MNLFRSEEHPPRWAQFNPAATQGAIGLPHLARLFGAETRHHLLDGNYISHWFPRRSGERPAILAELGMATPWWLGTA
jgi:hypothetical protein